MKTINLFVKRAKVEKIMALFYLVNSKYKKLNFVSLERHILSKS